MTRRKRKAQVVEYQILDDVELVALARQQLPYQMQAYEELLRRHENVLYAVCLRLTGNREDAEEIAQDVMLKVFSSIKRFEERSSYKTWLLRIARNASVDHLKKRAVAARYADSARYDVPDQAGETYEENHLLGLLQRLEQKDREVLTLRYVADLSIREVAAATDLSLSAAKMRLYRAAEKLRDLANPKQ